MEDAYFLTYLHRVIKMTEDEGLAPLVYTTPGLENSLIAKARKVLISMFNRVSIVNNSYHFPPENVERTPEYIRHIYSVLDDLGGISIIDLLTIIYLARDAYTESYSDASTSNSKRNKIKKDFEKLDDRIPFVLFLRDLQQHSSLYKRSLSSILSGIDNFNKTTSDEMKDTLMNQNITDDIKSMRLENAIKDSQCISLLSYSVGPFDNYSTYQENPLNYLNKLQKISSKIEIKPKLIDYEFTYYFNGVNPFYNYTSGNIYIRISDTYALQINMYIFILSVLALITNVIPTVISVQK